jgi:hypothetical protein
VKFSEPTTFFGMCDASAGFALTDDLFIAADDESNELRTYSRSKPGHPVAKLDLQRFLLIGRGDPESDIEGSGQVAGAFLLFRSPN